MIHRTVSIFFVSLAGFAWLFLAASPASAQIKLAKYPDIHKEKIVFSYLGDLWLANDDGSSPRRLTIHSARDTFPRFSPNGQWIAFSSNRYGGTDVFVIPAEGGKAKRITYHNASDTVVGWSRDSKRVLFTSARGVLYPMGIPNLYEAPVNGGLEKMVRTDWGSWGSYSPGGDKLAFNRHPMRWWRRHYRGSYAADLWVADLKNETFKRIVDDKTPDQEKANNLWPMYGNNGYVYFVSDRELKAKAGDDKVMKSTRNIWKVDENGKEPPERVTNHKFDELFYPSMSSDGRTIVYEGNFGLFRLDVASGQTKEIRIAIRSGDLENNRETITYNSEADSYNLSPSGKRAVISIHGELFSIATEKGATRRITGTPHIREGTPKWSPNGRWIAFIGNQKGQEDIYICDERGKGLQRLTDSRTEKGPFVWSPDSKSILFTTTDFQLFRMDVPSGKSKLMARSKISSISDPQWSPDGKWISFNRTGPNFLSHVYIMPADGGNERRITDDSSHQERLARWTGDGKRIVYLGGGDVTFSRRRGSRPSLGQLYSVPLQPDEEDPSDDEIDTEADAKNALLKKKKELFSKIKGGGKGPKKRKKVEVKIDFDGLARRAVRLTQLPDAITSVAVTPDGETVVFVTSSVEGGRPVQSLWKVSVTGGSPKRVAQSSPTISTESGRRRISGGGFSSLQFTKDGRKLYYRQGKSIYAMAFSGASKGGSRGRAGGPAALLARLRGGSSSSSSAPASSGKKVSFTARVQVDHRAQRGQVFQEAWFVMKHRFYDDKMHGVNWLNMLRTYEPLLDHCGSTQEMHDVVNMMLGELNASHTGISGGGKRSGSGSSSGARSPGFEMEENKSGYYRVSHIYKGGPADKGYIKLKAGDYILAVDDNPLKSGDNYYKAFADIADSRYKFTVNSKPNQEGAWTIKIKPISSSQLTNLQYEKWVNDRKETVKKMSKGRIGYLHIRQMSGSALEKFEKDLAALQHKKALIIDQRFNPGGNIDQELLKILQQKVYQLNAARGSVKRTRPQRGYFGRMVVLANERSTSDAEVFPDGFRTLGLGKVVGVTTYGAVIGTGSYRLMDGSTIRTPGMGLWNVDGTNLENFGVPPDVYVDNRPEDFFAGRDRQLQRAIDILQKELNNGK